MSTESRSVVVRTAGVLLMVRAFFYNVGDWRGQPCKERFVPKLQENNIITVEDENHCEFVYLRNFLTRTHLQDLIETTSQIHYESFRAKQLLALKESSAVGGHSSRPISPSADRELSRNSQRMTMNGY